MEEDKSFTWEVSWDQPIHPDPTVASRMHEVAIASKPDCDHGCKIYADPLSNARILHHNAAYGCRK